MFEAYPAASGGEYARWCSSIFSGQQPLISPQQQALPGARRNMNFNRRMVAAGRIFLQNGNKGSL